MQKRKAKMDALSSLSDEMTKMIGDDYAKDMGKMKVTVASDSQEGMEEGLSKAQEIMQKRLGEDAMGDSYLGERAFDSEPMEEAEEMMEDEMSEMEMDEDSPEMLKRKIEELQMKLAELEG